MSIEAMRGEIKNQVRDLPSFTSWLNKQSRPRVNPSRMVFAGAGDSYATALFARGLSSGAAEAWDPGELSLQPKRARNKYVFLVSVSGRTKANIDLAHRLKRLAKKRTAITAKQDSPLAKICDDKLLLRFRSSGIPTSGTVSFTASLLAVAYLLGTLPKKLSLPSSIRTSESWARAIEVPLKGDFYFLGSKENRALAEYGACKVQEVLGEKADAMFPEQLGHARLFSVDRRKAAVFCISGGRNDPAWKVSRALRANGFPTHSVTGQSRDTTVRSLEASFRLQHLALSIATKRGLNECRFLTDRSKLMLSNKLIY